MPLTEYAATEHSQRVPRWSILAAPPETYKHAQLRQLTKEALTALAFVWGVRRDGSNEQLAHRIVRRVQFRSTLAQTTALSLATRRREDLAAIAEEAGVYHPWLNRKNLAACLIHWRENARLHARSQIAAARHERIVRTAARKGLYVPLDNLLKYGIDADGRTEATILGVTVSRAMRSAPEAVKAARTLTQQEFCSWVKANRDLSAKLVFIGAGILGDGGTLFWREVQRAFKPPDIPPLFAGRDGSKADVFADLI